MAFHCNKCGRRTLKIRRLLTGTEIMCPCKSWKLKKLVFWVRASSALFELNCPRINYTFYKLAWPSDWRRVVTRAYSFLCTGKDRFYISVCRLRPIKIFSRKSGTVTVSLSSLRPRFFSRYLLPWDFGAHRYAKRNPLFNAACRFLSTATSVHTKKEMCAQGNEFHHDYQTDKNTPRKQSTTCAKI